MQRKKKKKIATTILFEGRKITTIFRTMYPFIRNICYMRYVFEFGPFHIPACILHLSALSELRNVRSNCCSLAHDRTPNLLYTYTIHKIHIHVRCCRWIVKSHSYKHIIKKSSNRCRRCPRITKKKKKLKLHAILIKTNNRFDSILSQYIYYDCCYVFV